MDTNDRSFFMVLSCNAYFVVSCGRMAIRFLGWIATAASMSSPGSRVTPSLAANAASPGKLPGAVSRQMAWLATVAAVANVTCSSALREVLLAALRQAIHRKAALQVMRVSLMDLAPCSWGWRHCGNHRGIGLNLLVCCRHWAWLSRQDVLGGTLAGLLLLVSGHRVIGIWGQPPFLRSHTLVNEHIKLTDSGRLVYSELLATSIVTYSCDEHRDDLAAAGVHHTMGKFTEALHEAVQRLLWPLG
jgi:hypothetical protein